MYISYLYLMWTSEHNWIVSSWMLCNTSVNAIPWDVISYKPRAIRRIECLWGHLTDCFWSAKDHTEILARFSRRKFCFQQVDIFFSHLIYVYLIYITYLNLYCRSKRGDRGFCPRFKNLLYRSMALLLSEIWQIGLPIRAREKGA